MKERIQRWIILCILGMVIFGSGLFVGFQFTDEKIFKTEYLYKSGEKKQLSFLREKDIFVGINEKYVEFVQGKRNAYFQNNRNEEISITDITTPTGEPDKHYMSHYTFWDSNGDGIAELHVRTVRDYYIFTYDDELTLWSTCYAQTELLNNGAFLYIHFGGAPSHEDFEYFVLDNQGDKVFSVYFSRYDSDSNGNYDMTDMYLFEGVEVSMQVWEKLTSKYLSVGSDEIEWLEIYGETT